MTRCHPHRQLNPVTVVQRGAIMSSNFPVFPILLLKPSSVLQFEAHLLHVLPQVHPIYLRTLHHARLTSLTHLVSPLPLSQSSPGNPITPSLADLFRTHGSPDLYIPEPLLGDRALPTNTFPSEPLRYTCPCRQAWVLDTCIDM
ncbi:hypothetical protein FALCPG4_011563 [Fusarium falciforme]